MVSKEFEIVCPECEEEYTLVLHDTDLDEVKYCIHCGSEVSCNIAELDFSE